MSKPKKKKPASVPQDDGQDLILHENFSANEDYKYEVFRNEQNLLETWLFHYDDRMQGYCLMEEYRLVADTLEAAIAQGEETLQGIEM